MLAPCQPEHSIGNCSIQGVRERLLFTLMPHRGRSNVLARKNEDKSNTFPTDLVCYNYIMMWEQNLFNLLKYSKVIKQKPYFK